MSFSIMLTSEPLPEDDALPGPAAKLGRIVIGSVSESFIAPLVLWDEDQYRNHWREAVRIVLEHRTPAYLLTTACIPEATDFLRTYLLYPIDSEVAIREHLLMTAHLPKEFDLDRPDVGVPPYVVSNEDGERISEWRLPRAQLQAFYESQLSE
jgi:hypothetical protein